MSLICFFCPGPVPSKNGDRRNGGARRAPVAHGVLKHAVLAGLLLTAGRMQAVEPGVAGAAAAGLPRYEWEATTGILWKVGGGATPLTYLVLPQILSLKIPPISERPWAGGRLVYRTRLSLLLEPIVRGPERYYAGFAAAGELEWRDPSRRFTAFFAGGGGFGWMNSKGYEVAGGQGQDFNLNWLLHAGVRYRMRSEWVGSAGVYFQHISNRGMDQINPGLNAVGPTLGLSRWF